MTHGSNTHALNPELTNEKVERIYHDWDAALARLEELPPERLDEGVDGLLDLYAKDAILESPLIPHLTGNERGLLQGHEQIRPFLREVGRRKPSVRKYYRRGYFTDGKKLIWEYPRQKPDGEHGFRGIDGTGRSRSDQTSRCVLGMARGECDAGRCIQTLDKN
jgi:hypothetical protein